MKFYPYKKLILALPLLFCLYSCGIFVGLGGYDWDSGGAIFHIVKPGESLYSIGQKYGVRYESIALNNGIHDVNRIYVGQQLLVSRGASERRSVNASGGFWSRKTTQNRSAHKLSFAGNKLLWPVEGGRLSSRFGPRRYSFHDGIDISAPSGTPIYAAHDGIVSYSGNGLSGYGNLLVIQSKNGFSTIYAHNRRVLVSQREFVRKGQRVAEVGETGRASGPHLHFELRVKDKRGRYLAIDPMPFTRK